jgi:eukaryotic-like serine/threonine-protein kinase
MAAREGIFQRRIALFFGVSACIGWFFYVLAFIVGMVNLPGDFRALGHPMRVLHIANTLFCTIVWLIARGDRALSESTLTALDLGGSIFLLAGLSGMLLNVPAWSRPEIEFLLTFGTILAARAAIVPSTATRTFAIGMVAAAFLTASTVRVYATWDGVPNPMVHNPIVPGAPPYPLIPTATNAAVVAIAWSLINAFVASMISRVIYGLQRRIEQVEELGQYRLDEKIGEGGMGVVYRASHAMLRRPTAIKLLPPDRAGDAALARFEREVQNTARLTHPNTIAIYDYGRTPEGVFYYAMEYLDGVDLEALVAIDGPQPAMRVVQVLAQVAGALAEAHAVGLIHRDIKPGNVILCERGGVCDFAKVVDFGLVKDVSRGSPSTSTVSVITGTPLYMSPESIVSPDTIDGRSDLYALGAVGYFLLTGKPVFEAQTVLEVCARHLHAEVVAPSKRADREVPPALEALILECLAKDADARPQSAGALAARLATIEGAGWSESDAREWWSLHRGKLRTREVDPNTVSPHARTVGVDWSQRA